MDIVDKIIQAYGLKPNLGVNHSELLGVGVKTGLTLPLSFRDFYLKTNGLTVDEFRLQILPLNQVADYYEALCNFGISPTWGLLPFTESNDSNPFCISCTEPLFGRIIHLFHDDAPSLDFPSLDAFLEGIHTLLKNKEWDDWDIYDLEPAYDDNHENRTPEDVAAAFDLLQKAHDLEEEDGIQAILFALKLFPKNEVSEIIKFLEHEDMWVREETANRLAGIKSAEALPHLQRLAKGDRQDARAASRAIQEIRKTMRRRM